MQETPELEEPTAIALPDAKARPSMVMHEDSQIVEAGSDISRELGKQECLAIVQQGNASMVKLLDADDEYIQEHLRQPIKRLIDNSVEDIVAISVSDPEETKRQVEAATIKMQLMRMRQEEIEQDVRKEAARIRAEYSDNVEAQNKALQKTVSAALESYLQRVETEIGVRQKVMQQMKAEHDVWLEQNIKECEAKALAADLTTKSIVTREEKLLEVQRKKDESQHQKELKAQERAERAAEKEIEIQRKKLENEHNKHVKELERDQRKNQQEHEKMMKELDVKARKGKIEQEARDCIQQEMKIEMDRYNREYDLAQDAMRDALKKGRGCRITHTAPKIDWGPPPRVVPGSVSWTHGC